MLWHRQRGNTRGAGWALLLTFVVLLSSCSDDPKTTAVVVAPVLGPHVDESLLALDVRSGMPVGITSYYQQGDVVHLWVRWVELEPPHDAEAVWYNPSAQEVAAAIVTIADGPPGQVTEFSFKLLSSATVGRWEVVLYLDGELRRSHVFDVFPGP